MECTKFKVRNLKINKVAALGLIAFLFAVNANAAELSGVTFNEQYEDSGIKMSLQGLGQERFSFLKLFSCFLSV